MSKFQQYCQLLGVNPGDNAYRVRQNFRERIKSCHPDAAKTASSKETAQLLIEAYSEFKNGVPQLRAQQSSHWGQYAKSASYPNYGSNFNHKAYTTSTKQKSDMAAKRMFEVLKSSSQSFNKKRQGKDFFSCLENIIEENIYPLNEEDEVWEYDLTMDRNTTVKAKADGMYENNNFLCAEVILRETVRSFENSHYRMGSTWAREFIGELVQIQVVYRDICQSTLL